MLTAETRAVKAVDEGLLPLAEEAVVALEGLLARAVAGVRMRVVRDGRVDPALFEAEQRAAHGLAWLATYVESLRQMAAYGTRLSAEGRFGEAEALIVRIAVGEYLAQAFGGLPMSQNEILRPADMGLTADDLAAARTPAVEALLADGNTAAARAALVGHMRAGGGAATVGDAGLDETMEAIRGEIRRFADAEVLPYAHGWDLANE